MSNRPASRRTLFENEQEADQENRAPFQAPNISPIRRYDRVVGAVAHYRNSQAGNRRSPPQPFGPQPQQQRRSPPGGQAREPRNSPPAATNTRRSPPTGQQRSPLGAQAAPAVPQQRRRSSHEAQDPTMDSEPSIFGLDSSLSMGEFCHRLQGHCTCCRPLRQELQRLRQRLNILQGQMYNQLQEMTEEIDHFMYHLP